MSNALTIIRSLVVYSLCLPLAIFLGYLLAMPMDTMSFTVVVLALSLPLVPLLIKHHHLLVFACWNTSVVLFFLPGRPNLGLVMTIISFGLALGQHILNRNIRFNHAPSVSRPLILLAIVIIMTAQVTGGFGARLMGSDTYGGKRYFILLAAIMGYFAMACFRVPPGKATLYVALYLLGTITGVVGNLAPFVDSSLYFIFALFPVENLMFIQGGGSEDALSARMGGLTFAGLGGIYYILARHGIRGLFDFRESWSFSPIRFRDGFGFNNPWRFLIFLFLLWISLLGGFRATVVILGLTFLIQFYLEGLFRSQLLPALLLVGTLLVAMCLPFVNKLPMTIQRSISFLPVEIDPVARYGAESTIEWRLRIWREVLPMVPQYLIVGKGYAINPGELNMSLDLARSSMDTAQTALLSGDYHNGPLSLIIPLGLPGVFAFVWFLFAGFRVLLNNYRYGDPELFYINSFILAYFVGRTIFFFTIFGAFHGELMIFTGLVGLSVSINGGVRQPAPVVVERPVFDQFKLARAAR